MSKDSLTWEVEPAPLPSHEINYLGKRVDDEGRRRATEEAAEQILRDKARQADLNRKEQARIAMNNTVVEQGENDD